MRFPIWIIAIYLLAQTESQSQPDKTSLNMKRFHGPETPDFPKKKSVICVKYTYPTCCARLVENAFYILCVQLPDEPDAETVERECYAKGKKLFVCCHYVTSAGNGEGCEQEPGTPWFRHDGVPKYQMQHPNQNQHHEGAPSVCPPHSSAKRIDNSSGKNAVTYSSDNGDEIDKKNNAAGELSNTFTEMQLAEDPDNTFALSDV